MRILKKHEWHPYKMQTFRNVSKGDPDGRIEFCEWAVDKLDGGANFSSGNLFTEEANVYINVKVNRQNVRYWSDTNPHWMNPPKM
jgi:hypothetical protein